MNLVQKLAVFIIRKSFHFSVWTIEQICQAESAAEKTSSLKKYPIGTLGNDIGKCLEENGLRLVPRFESHDLKHVLLQYEMTPIDEIRLQAFMIGNGNYTFASFAIFLFGALLLPDCWRIFYHDFKKGSKCMPVRNWSIESHGHFSTQDLRHSVYHYQHQKPSTMSLRKLGSYISIFTGIAGMIVCLPFLFSSSLADLVGAGFPFVGGAIIASAGLISLSTGNRKAEQPASCGIY